MRYFIPESAATHASEDEFGRLAEAYAYPVSEADRPWLRANMVSSGDGAAQFQGVCEGLSGPSDKKVFDVLRALADVVLVGEGTVLKERYTPIEPLPALAARRATGGQSAAPALAVVCDSPALLDYTGPLFTAPEARTVVITTRRACADGAFRSAALAADVVEASAPGQDDTVDLRLAVTALAARGWTRLLCEGGPMLLARIAAAGLLDELCLSVSPKLTAGYAKRITDGPDLAEPLVFELAGLLEENGFLFLRYRRAGAVTG